jgi:hypothetical protein
MVVTNYPKVQVTKVAGVTCDCDNTSFVNAGIVTFTMTLFQNNDMTREFTGSLTLRVCVCV